MLTVHTLPLGMLQANCYIFHRADSNECLVVDPGEEAGKVLAFLEQQGLTCKGIALTHRHFDHVGAARTLSGKLGCPVYLHGEDLAQKPLFPYGSDYHTDTYEDGDTLSLAGMTVTVLHTPGHCPGCVCLQCGDVLFTGDTLFAGSCGRVDFPGSSPSDMRRSLQRLALLPGDYTVYPGHGEATTLQAERCHNPYMKGYL